MEPKVHILIVDDEEIVRESLAGWLGDDGYDVGVAENGARALERLPEKDWNLAMVDLEPIPEEDRALEELDHQGGDLETHGKVDIKADMTRYDALRLHRLIEQHAQYTGSGIARQILDNWNDYLPKFVKVMPVDYRRALEEMKQAQTRELAAAASG